MDIYFIIAFISEATGLPVRWKYTCLVVKSKVILFWKAVYDCVSINMLQHMFFAFYVFGDVFLLCVI